tara:strand:- start:746 stop:1090 length:345 start_codon:yes stop_codon:yes gene_type:complete
MKEKKNTTEVGHSDNYYVKALLHHISKECGEMEYFTCTLKKAQESARRLEAFAHSVITERDARSEREALLLLRGNPREIKADGTRHKMSPKMRAEMVEFYMDEASGSSGKLKHG